MSREQLITFPPPPAKPRRSWSAWDILFVLILPLALGTLLARQLFPRPVVGIIRLNGEIWSASAEYVRLQIEEARLDKSVQALVFQINSPGGDVVSSQAIYLDILSLREEMPVAASIDSIAASGGYYAVIAAEPVLAKPSSDVGNVGVWGVIPPTVGVDDIVLASGPFKLTASNSDEFLRMIESVRQEFLAVVAARRGEKMQLSQAELSQGLAYSGRKAVELGLIDGLGSLNDAIERAASQGGIRNYEVMDYAQIVYEKYYAEADAQAQWVGAADPLTGERSLPPGIYLLYDPLIGGAP
jgi:protease-4